VKTLSKITPQIFSVQGDLELPFSFGTIETGVKFNQFRNSADLKYLDFEIINTSLMIVKAALSIIVKRIMQFMQVLRKLRRTLGDESRNTV
jgi:hypothetical protein